MALAPAWALFEASHSLSAPRATVACKGPPKDMAADLQIKALAGGRTTPAYHVFELAFQARGWSESPPG